MDWEDHGGGCCGVFHLYDIYPVWPKKSHTKKEWVWMLKGQLDEAYSERSHALPDNCSDYWDMDVDELDALDFLQEVKERGGYLCEVYLTDDQLIKHPPLVKAIKELGFELVGRFKNGNTTNMVNLFIQHQDHYPLKDVPFDW